MSYALVQNPAPTPPHRGEGLNLPNRPTAKSPPRTLRSKEAKSVPHMSPSHLWGGVGEGPSASYGIGLATIGSTSEEAPTSAPISLIPVLVTGIQPPRVGAVNDSCNVKEPLAPKDLGALDSCDIPRAKPRGHRNEDGEVQNPTPTPHKGEGLNLPRRLRRKSSPRTLWSKEISPSHLWGGVGEGSSSRKVGEGPSPQARRLT
ncbi:hypothetical protein Rleg4DRAFT_1533 [Rhizobium leguminosarum bv. trifolii WSM2297]|uniref:Uncharacterized protein n=1 Tax=Rhizobium leguminosarum bv. trifolii WSM2297 TaxID=754762 RepID=J0CA22_RHILT|nr:hypothetical protein Rleg4DRAFT_1533 [Rhizobium leguminosarum bv. trifolii WSM2297]